MANGPRTVPFTMNQYIAFSVDPFDTLKSLNDPEVDAITRAMETKTFVGRTKSLLSGLIADGDYRSWSLQFVFPRLPASSEAEGIEPGMCVPIDPTTHHPASREPLRPIGPFPWSGCYRHSYSVFASVRTKLNKKEEITPTRLTGMESAYRITHPPPASSPVVHQIPPDTPHDEDADAYSIAGSLSEGSVNPVQDEEGPGTDPQELANVFIDAFHNEPPETMIVVNATFDLSSIAAPADPAEFFKEKAYLEQLEKESRARAIERAQKMDDEAYSTPKRSKSKRAWLNPCRAWSRLRLHLNAAFQMCIPQRKSAPQEFLRTISSAPSPSGNLTTATKVSGLVKKARRSDMMARRPHAAQ
ncbi:hypothetical protein PLICRDRAFT_700857 [Plicaturopsis crispa FD-325 SS-3]|nr:hypothetical protein PLICRDRAFT_700857 [Plicaturopsis crispa FD-325 SS-3]